MEWREAPPPLVEESQPSGLSGPYAHAPCWLKVSLSLKLRCRARAAASGVLFGPKIGQGWKLVKKVEISKVLRMGLPIEEVLADFRRVFLAYTTPTLTPCWSKVQKNMLICRKFTLRIELKGHCHMRMESSIVENLGGHQGGYSKLIGKPIAQISGKHEEDMLYFLNAFLVGHS